MIVILDVNDRDFAAVAGLAEAAVKAKTQQIAAIGGLALFLESLQRSGSARVQAQHVERSNVVSLRRTRASVRVG